MYNRFKHSLRNTLVQLCLAHIKISDRAIKIWSTGRPIYPVRLFQIGRRRTVTLKIFTADHSWEHVSLADSPATFWESGDYRPMIGRPVTDIYA